jgi:hypothetical protein
MKWRSASSSTPVEVDPGDRPAQAVQTATEDPRESLLSRIAVLESREQVLKTELENLQTDLVELRQHLDDPSANTRPSAPDEMDIAQANDPQHESVSETAATTASLDARYVDVLSEASLVEPETPIPPPPDGSAGSHDASADPLDGLLQTDLSGYLLRPVDVGHERGALGEPEPSTSLETTSGSESEQAPGRLTRDVLATHGGHEGAPWPLVSRGMGETENSPSNAESAQGAKPSPAASAQPVSAIDDLIQEAVESRGRYRNSYDPPTDPHAESELTASAIPVDQSPSGADPDTSLVEPAAPTDDFFIRPEAARRGRS